jgi:hypothetical protein
MEYNGIKFQKLSFLQQYYDDPQDGIPANSGIYYWVHFPDFDPITTTADQLKDIINEFASKTLYFEEKITGNYKFEATIKEQGYPENGQMFGLSKAKSIKLHSYFQNQVNREFFKKFFIDVCFSRPFYIGKAKNLKTRLVTQHFKRRSSDILDGIDKHVIPGTDIWIGYKEIEDLNNDDLNVIFEEIFSRRIKPAFTKKPN